MELTEEQLSHIEQSATKANAGKKEAKKNDKAQEKIVCPCCGAHTLSKPLKIDPEWMDQYMACMLTGEPYSQEYQLFRGNVNLLIMSMTTDMADKMRNALMAVEGFNNLTTEPMAVDAAIQLMQIYYMIREITISVKGKKTLFAPYAVVDKVLDDILEIRNRIDDGKAPADIISAEIFNKVAAPMKDVKKVSGIPVQTLKTVVLIHDQMLRVLTESAFDSTFWSRIKLA